MTRAGLFIARRLIGGLLTLLVMTTLTFVIFWATPTQPAVFVYPNASHLTAYTIARGNHLLGTDRSEVTQYLRDVPRLFIGDFGTMWSGAQLTPEQTLAEQPIAPQLMPSFRVTLSLLLGGAALVVLLAIPLGTFAGSKIGSPGDRAVSLVALLGVCTHPMVIGILVRSLFAHRLQWLPPTGYCPLRNGTVGCNGVVDWASHLLLPWITFALLFLALYVRMVRVSVAETLHEDFIRTARAKGAGGFRILASHVLPNAGLRVLTMIGMEIGTAIGVCIYIETAYALPGLASVAVRTMAGDSAALDLPMLLAIVFLVSLIVVIGNLTVDALTFLVDPRVAVTRDRGATKSAAGGVI